jgi:hypothetical protein
MRKVLAVVGLVLLASCSTPPPAADPAVVAKINYVCAYSGEFQLVAGGASLIPVPGLGAAVSDAELAAQEICKNPVLAATAIADGKVVVDDLIAKFHSVGKM